MSSIPVIPGFHPDPSICRVGGDYYVAHSSFEYSPGVPIWHSRDLVQWTQIGNALARPAQFPDGVSRAGRGVYAPTLRHRDGVFHLITTNVDSPGGGQILFRADRAEGPWSDAVLLPGLQGIDPDLAWDEEGRCLVSYCAWNDREAGIMQAAVDLDSGAVIEEPRWIWHGSGLGNPEGPHLLLHDGWWYLVIAEGGTDRGHAISVARSRRATGPFEGAPSNPVLSHRSTRHPVQNVGHADLVALADGRWAAVHLGARPRGTSPRYHVNGRETFLVGVDWVDGWPVFDETAFDAPRRPLVFEDRFDAAELHPRWVSPGLAPSTVAEATGSGVRLRGAAAPSGEATGLFARVAGDSWRAEVELEARPSARWRLQLRVDSSHWYGLESDGESVVAVSQVGSVRAVVGRAEQPSGPRTTLALASLPATCGGPDDVELSVLQGGGWWPLARLDGRYLSTEVAGGFTGRMLGLSVLDRSEVVLERVSFVSE